MPRAFSRASRNFLTRWQCSVLARSISDISLSLLCMSCAMCWTRDPSGSYTRRPKPCVARGLFHTFNFSPEAPQPQIFFWMPHSHKFFFGCPTATNFFFFSECPTATRRPVPRIRASVGTLSSVRVVPFESVIVWQVRMEGSSKGVRACKS